MSYTFEESEDKEDEIHENVVKEITELEELFYHVKAAKHFYLKVNPDMERKSAELWKKCVLKHWFYCARIIWFASMRIKQNWSSLNQWATCIWKVEGKEAKIDENIVKEISIKELEGFKLVATAKDFYPKHCSLQGKKRSIRAKRNFHKSDCFL